MSSIPVTTPSVEGSLPERGVQADAHPETTNERIWRVLDATCDGLYRFILVRVGGRRDVADDLIQQTCCLAARHPSLPVDDDGCEAWLRGIARNLVLGHWRQEKRRGGWIPIEDVDLSRQLADDMEKHPLPPDVLAKEELRLQLMLAITQLPAADQALILAFYFEARPQAEIAEGHGTTVKSIETRLYRARRRLRTILRDPKRMD